MKFMTKKEAFISLENEQNIPIDVNQFKFKFTRKWFRNRNQKTWSTFLLPRYKRRNRIKPWNVIQIGVFEGMDLIWCLQNFLHHSDSRVLAIDPWLPTKKEPDMESCYGRALHNLKPWKKRVHIERALSKDVLSKIIDDGIIINDRHIKAGEWDLIIVDGNHNASAVFIDAINSLKLIGKNRWIIFDDYHNRIRKKHHVQEGVEDFLDLREDSVKLVWQHRFCLCLERIK